MRWLLLAAVGVMIAAAAAIIVHVRRYVVPPDCRDPQTLALVEASLTERFHMPPSAHLSHIETLAGGPLAFRFVCQADLEVDPALLPPGPRPGFVHYTSQLTGKRRRQEVTVEIQPLMIWEQVQ